jgi:MarR family transcriptional regulator for hemolysin
MRSIRVQMRRKTSPELSVVQFRSLALADRPGGASVSEIAEHIGLTLPSASKLVDGLVRRGYLRRRPHPSDRRKTLLASTPKGTRVLDTARRATRRHLAGLLQDVPGERLARLATAMETLRPIFVIGSARGPHEARKPHTGTPSAHRS